MQYLDGKKSLLQWRLLEGQQNLNIKFVKFQMRQKKVPGYIYMSPPLVTRMQQPHMSEKKTIATVLFNLAIFLRSILKD